MRSIIQTVRSIIACNWTLLLKHKPICIFETLIVVLVIIVNVRKSRPDLLMKKIKYALLSVPLSAFFHFRSASNASRSLSVLLVSFYFTIFSFWFFVFRTSYLGFIDFIWKSEMSIKDTFYDFLLVQCVSWLSSTLYSGMYNSYEHQDILRFSALSLHYPNSIHLIS